GARARHVSLRVVAGLAALTALASCCGGECAQRSSAQSRTQSVSSPPVTVHSDALRVGAISPPTTSTASGTATSAIPPPPSSPAASASGAAPSPLQAASPAASPTTAAAYPREFRAFVA